MPSLSPSLHLDRDTVQAYIDYIRRKMNVTANEHIQSLEDPDFSDAYDAIARMQGALTECYEFLYSRSTPNT